MSTSAAHAGNDVADRIKIATNTMASDNQSLLIDIRKSINIMQEIAVEMEKLHRTDEVKELEKAVVELLTAHEDCTAFSDVMISVGDKYRPAPELTDFKKLFKDEKSKRRGASASELQKNPLLRRFREAVWNVHHKGQLMPGEENEDIVMTNTQVALKNTVCPMTGKPVTELSEPVRSKDCKHVYDKAAIMHYLKNNTKGDQCPVSGCPRPLRANRVVCDPLLLVEIEEMRSLNKQTDKTAVFEDFTALDEED